MQINIHQIQIDIDSKLKELIEKKVTKLNHFSDKIEYVDVYLKLETNHHQINDKSVEIKLHIPKHECFSKSISKSFEYSIDEAIDSVTAQLKKLKERY
ncbi:MAG: ribosome-associated translation inhibitor RaiA [Alphaproteobacteria bacterium]|nr:ribosome-associated translation inhibitor RaiA [Alphaproteobacteria bacterium]